MSKYVSLDNLTRYDGKIKEYIGTATASFITKSVNDLTNYYLKSETYTKSEVNSLISAISTIDIQVVQTLPTQDISTSTIYLVPKSTAQTNNTYDEYIYVSDGASTPTYSWEKIGDTEIDLSDYVTDTELATELSGKQDTIDSSHKVSADLIDDSNTTNKFTNASDIIKLSGIESGAEVNVQSDWSETDTADDAYIKNKPTIPTNVSDLTNDAGYITGMTILTYGTSTWNDFITAYNANKVVYARVDGRMAFMAYLSSASNPTSVEFQYYRSASSPSYGSQPDEVFIYRLTNASGGTWTTTTRKASTSTSVVSNTGLDYTYSSSARQLSLSGSQRISLPNANSNNVGKVYQYIGNTNSNYTNGYFYKCTNSSGSYKWEQLDVQPSSGGAKYVINIEYTNFSERIFSNYNTEDNRNVFQQIYNNYSNIKAGDVVVAVKYNNTIEVIYNVENISLRSNQLRISLRDINTSGSSGVYNVWYRSYIVNDFYSNFSNDVVGNIENYRGVQYIPENNESILGVNNTTAYTPTGDYNPATKKYVDDSVATKQDILQYSTMPTASSTTVGNIIQYTGTTDNTYTNGYFYIGTTDGESTPTYSWEQIDIQPSSGGGTWGSITGTLSNQEDLNDELLMRPVINPTIVIGSSTYSTPLIIDELDPGAYFIKNTGGNGTNYVRLDSSIQSNVNLQCVGSGYDGAYNSGVYLYIPKAIDYSNLTDGDILFYVNTDRNTYDNGYMVDAILTYVYDSTVTSKMKIDETKTISKGIGLPLTQGTQGFYGKKTFYSGIASDVDPLGDKDLTTKKYVDTSHPVVHLSKDVYPNPWSYNDLWDLEYNPSYPYTFAYGGEGWNDYWTNTHSTTTSKGIAYIKMNFPEQLVGKEVTVNYEFTVPSGATGHASIYYNTTNKLSKSSSTTGSFTISSVVSGDYITLNCQKMSEVSGITLNVYFTFPDLISVSQIYAIKCSKVAKEIYDEISSNYDTTTDMCSKTYLLELRGPDMYEGTPDYSIGYTDRNFLFRYRTTSGTVTSFIFEKIPTITSDDDEVVRLKVNYNSDGGVYSLDGPTYSEESSYKPYVKIYEGSHNTKSNSLILEEMPNKDFIIGTTAVNTASIYVKAHTGDTNSKALLLTNIVGNVVNFKNTIELIDGLEREMAVLSYKVGTVYDSTNNKICNQVNTLYYDPVNDVLRLDEVKTPLNLTIPDSIQVSTMPTASSTLEGNVVQYIGATDTTYIKGYFYECVSDGESTPTYSWENIDVCDVPEDFVLGIISNSTTNPNSGTSSQPIILSTMAPGKYRVVGSRTIYVKLDTTSTTTTSKSIGDGYFILPRKIDTSKLSDGDVVAHFEAYGITSGSLKAYEYNLLYKPNETSGVLFSGGVGTGTMASGIVTTSDSQTISGTKTFSAIPSCSVTPTSNNHLVNKSYVDSIVGDIQSALAALVDGTSS